MAEGQGREEGQGLTMSDHTAIPEGVVHLLDSIDRHLQTISESALKQNELLAELLGRTPLPPVPATKRGICKYCGVFGEGDVCESCQKAGG
jgi:hypothetical protein